MHTARALLYFRRRTLVELPYPTVPEKGALSRENTDVEKVKMRVQNHWNTIVGEGYWRSTYKARALMRYVIPRGLDKEVAVAGSSALLWFQDQGRVGPMWEGPHDIDVFVAGHYGETRRRFRKFVRSIVTKIRKAGVVVDDKRCYEHPYIVRDKQVSVWDIVLVNVDNLRISFIQSPGKATVAEVVERFDIDVCRVVYLIHQERFVVNESVRHHIESGLAWADAQTFVEDGGPDVYDVEKVRSTLWRIRKYTQRGFHVLNGGGVVFGLPQGQEGGATARRVSI